MPIPFKINIANIIRDSIHNLIVPEENELENEDFFNSTKKIIGTLEGCEYEAYIDGIDDKNNKGKFISAYDFYKKDKKEREKLWKESTDARDWKMPITTVGIGANIESQSVRDQFDLLLGEPGLMDKVYYGKIALTDKQVSRIFRHQLEERLVEIKNIYNTDWNKLRANEKIAIMSLYFNSRKLVNDSTRFRQHIANYVKTNDRAHLIKAVEEVKERSNRNNDPGIQNRRDSEAKLLASYESPAYTKPNQSPESVKLTMAKLDETIIPRSNFEYPSIENKEYYI